MSTLKELEDKLALAYAARSPNPHTGQLERTIDFDHKFRRDVFNLEVEVQNARAAEAKHVEINADQQAQLQWLDRMSTATDSRGRQIFFEHDERGRTLRNALDLARMEIAKGKTLGPQTVKYVQEEAKSAGAVSYPELPKSDNVDFLPPPDYRPHPGEQSTGWESR